MATPEKRSNRHVTSREEMDRIRDLARDCQNDVEFLARLWGLDPAMFINDPEPREYTEIRFVNPFGLLSGKSSTKTEQGDME